MSRLVKNSDGLEMFSSKSAYLARVQRFFEIGPNAFTLLNRAAGLKQLNSIDEIFRDLVLDDHSAFDDALRVAGGFQRAGRHPRRAGAGQPPMPGPAAAARAGAARGAPAAGSARPAPAAPPCRTGARARASSNGRRAAPICSNS